MNNKFSIRIKLLLLTLIPLLALILASVFAYTEVKSSATQIRQEAYEEVAMLTSFGEEIVNYVDGKTPNKLLAIDQNEVKAFLAKINSSVEWASSLEQATLERIVLFASITIFFTIFLNIYISSRISKNLKKAVSIANRIGSGERNIEIDDISNDETGVLLKSLIDMQTNIVHAEASLLEHEKLVRVITDSIPALICYVDQNERYHFCNLPYAQSFSKSPDEFIGKTMREMIGEKIHNKIKNYLDSALQGERIVFELDYVNQHSRKYMQGNYIPDFDKAGKVRGIFSIFHDVTRLAEIKNELEKKQKDLEDLSTKDALTGVNNRRSLYGQIEAQITQLRENKTPFSLIMLDIDHFKRINDVYGHNAGDEVLRTLSQVLKARSRETDFIYRFGGEEFSIILVETVEEDGLSVAERLRFFVEETKTHIGEGRVISFTISLGLAECGPTVENAQELIVIADEALYNAKKQGRNRVVVARDRLGVVV